MRKIFPIGLTLLGFLLAAAAGLAQAPTGTIAGTVTDVSEAVIPGAKITITNKETGLERAVTASATGLYSAAALPAGTYEVRAEATGFQMRQRLATVETGSTTTVDFRMAVGAPLETVRVEAASPQLQTDSHKIDGVITRVQVDNLPLNGRNFLQLAMLEPGVTVSTQSLAQYNAQFSVSVLGGSSSRTRITVDGANVVNAIEGGTQQNFSQELIQEFQVSSVNFDLSTGISAVGAVNIVTRSGGNDFHGGGYFFFRDHNMAAYPALRRDPVNPDPFFARRQSGFYLGGPIKKDRFFFFFNLEHNNQDGVITAQPRTADFARFGRIVANPYTATQISTRFDLRLGQNHNMFVRYSHDGNDGFGPRSGTPLPSNWLTNDNWADLSTLSLISTLRPTLVNNARFSYTYWRNRNFHPTAKDCPGDCIGLGFPLIDVSGTGFVIGNTDNAPQGRDLRRYITSNDMTWQRSAHRLHFGGEWDYQRGTGFWAFQEPAVMRLWSPDDVRRRLPQFPLPATFNTIEDILRLPLIGFSTGIGDPSQPPLFQINNAKDNHRLHLYAQDTWRIRPRFTLNYGLAWSYENNLLNHDLTKPDYLSPIFGGPDRLKPSRRDRNNFSPSLGFAWGVTKDNKTILRGGAGVYYDTHLIFERLIERSIIGPRGNGRFPIPGDFVPNPIPGIPGVPLGTPLRFSSNPTAFTGAHLMAILPQVRIGLRQQLGDPRNPDLSIRNIEIFKSGSDLLTPDYATPYAQHYSLGVQREIVRDLVVTADFVFRQFMREQMGNIDYNYWDSVTRPPAIRPCQGAEIQDPRVRCSAGEIGVRTTAGRSSYTGLLVKVDKRFSRRTQFLASYALSRQYGFNGIVNKDNWFESMGPRGGRHLLNVSGLVELPWDFQVSAISSIGTKGPFNVTLSGLDFNGDGTNGDRLPGTTQNQFNRGLGRSDLVRLVTDFNQNLAGRRTPRNQLIPTVTLPEKFDFGDNFYAQDLRLSKFFRFGERYKLTLIGEVFNLFNIANLSGYSGNLLDSSFGQPANRTSQVFGSGGPRAFQFAVRLTF